MCCPTLCSLWQACLVHGLNVHSLESCSFLLASCWPGRCVNLQFLLVHGSWKQAPLCLSSAVSATIAVAARGRLAAELLQG